MITTLYLIRHGATAANLERPNRLQGRRTNPPLAPLGVRQAELTRDVLAIRPIDRIFSSPLERALQTARIIAAAWGQHVQPLDALTECDVGRWEGLSWETIAQQEPEAYRHFHANPAHHGYPEGESFADVAHRCIPAIDDLMVQHAGKTLLVVAHHIVNRIYLASRLGLSPAQARRVKLDNCGISIVLREGDATEVATLNATFHLHGACAAA